jgi:hypothetical protein
MKDILQLGMFVKYPEKDHAYSQNGNNKILHSCFL